MSAAKSKVYVFKENRLDAEPAPRPIYHCEEFASGLCKTCFSIIGPTFATLENTNAMYSRYVYKCNTCSMEYHVLRMPMKKPHKRLMVHPYAPIIET